MIFSPRRWTLFVEPAASSLRAFQRAKTRPSLREDKNFEEAALKYKAALHLDPNYANAHNNLGLALYNQGKLDDAIAELEIAVHLEPTDTVFR
ncbi:MAG: tetratricopeptide repeat protein, partial [Hassallia sp.]